LDLTRDELDQIIDAAAALKRDRANWPDGKLPLKGKHVALMFEKPSLRTRATFTIAVRELGGDVVDVPPNVATGARESVKDVAHNLERWVVACVVRTFGQNGLRQLAAAASRMHVLNALTDEEHPCQVLADMLTLRERFGSLRGRTLAFVGDGNNVATSLAHASALLGLKFRVASPDGYMLSPDVVRDFEQAARDGASIELMSDPAAAVSGASAVYTDAWTSMGQERESATRERVFKPYQVNTHLMSLAAPDAVFMHCLPAHRGAEVTDDVMDGAASVVIEQAENRLHTQKALLAFLVAH